MDERARRIGTNEGIFRAVNEQIEGLARGMAEISDRTLHIVCECGDLACADQVVIPIEEYERIRADPVLFFVLPGHELPDVETVVERNATYHIVRKDPGGPAEIAEATDPRGSG